MKPERIRIAMDYLTFKVPNTGGTLSAGLKMAMIVLGTDVSKSKYFETKDTKCYFFKHLGIDVKVSRRKVVFEIHSTFFAKYHNDEPYEIIKGMRRTTEKVFGALTRVIEIHIAQDFKKLPVDSFWPKRKGTLHFNFENKKDSGSGGKVERGESINIREPRYKWKLTIYNKTLELKENTKNSTREKKEYYKGLGYIKPGVEITRCELKLKSDPCKRYIQIFEKNYDEDTVCKAIIQKWYETHKVKSITSGETSKSKIKRANIWPKWKYIFDIKSKERIGIPKEEMRFKETHNADIDIICRNFLESNAKCQENPREFFRIMMTYEKEFIEKAEKHKEDLRRTHEYILALRAA